MADCKRCGNTPLADYYCEQCSALCEADSDEAHRLDENNHLWDADDEHGAVQYKCSCGCETFTVKYQDYCSWCEHQVAKGN